MAQIQASNGVRTLNILSNAGKSFDILPYSITLSPLSNEVGSKLILLFIHSLEKDPPRRATPWKMLEHPWMVEMKSKKVNMERFLQQVWDWKD